MTPQASLHLSYQLASGALLAAAVLVAVACADSSGPAAERPGLSVMAGADQADTALARLPSALVVRVRGADGSLAVGEVVRFESMPNGSPPWTGWVYLANTTSPTYGALATAATDAQGEATVLLRLGSAAGTGRVAVSAPRLGFQDTVAFTVLPASPHHLVVAPRDTALYVGRSYSIRGYVADAYENRRADSVAYQRLDSGITVSVAGGVTGVAYGRSAALLTAVGTGITDTARVSVVPQGTLAALAGNSSIFPLNVLVTMNLDGSGVAVVPQSAGDNNYLQWVPDGTSLLFYRGRFSGHLYTLSLTGALARVVQPVGFAEDNWGRFAAGGSYIYFRGGRAEGGPGYIWRIRPDGTGLDSLHLGVGTQPAPSPDGTRVAYVDAAGALHVYDVGTATDVPLGVSGWAPHWSPDGAWIAFDDGQTGLLSVVRPDGTGSRVLASSGTFEWSFDWSPDSRWLLGFGMARGSLCVIQVATGLTLPLPFTPGLWMPTWKP